MPGVAIVFVVEAGCDSSRVMLKAAAVMNKEVFGWDYGWGFGCAWVGLYGNSQELSN